MCSSSCLNCSLQVLHWQYKEQKHLKLDALTWISGTHLKLLLWVPCLQGEQISPGIFFSQWSCCLLAGTSTQGAGWSKASWGQQGCNHQDNEVRGNPSASSVETGACGTLTDPSLRTCVINCIHNFLLSSKLLASTRCFWALCAAQCASKLLVADEWARTVGQHYSKHSQLFEWRSCQRRWGKWPNSVCSN